MGAGFSYQGASSQHYGFALLDIANVRDISWSPGVVIFAKYIPAPLFVGNVDSLYSFFLHARLWRKAQTEYAASLVYFLPIPDGKLRQAIVVDLLENYEFPMNRV
jgi:hypothetical protein